MRLSLSADDVKLDVTKSSTGFDPKLAAARNGQLLLELTRAELTQLLMAFAQAAAAEQGAKIESADLQLAQAGERAVSAVLRIKAKKMMVSATVVVEGRADVDERLSVRLSQLRASGEGMMGNMVAGLLAGKLKQAEGQTFEAAPPALRNLRLQGLKLDAADPLRITAAFES